MKVFNDEILYREGDISAQGKAKRRNAAWLAGPRSYQEYLEEQDKEYEMQCAGEESEEEKEAEKRSKSRRREEPWYRDDDSSSSDSDIRSGNESTKRRTTVSR